MVEGYQHFEVTSSTMMMEAQFSLKRCYLPENSHLHTHDCENLLSQSLKSPYKAEVLTVMLLMIQVIGGCGTWLLDM
jgi:hypothetical protein